MMGGSMAHEYMYLTPVGEDTLVLCDKCGYCSEPAGGDVSEASVDGGGQTNREDSDSAT